ncbi:unnamed protein product [Linum tenue]|uniref:Dof zinc finger protein n=1 Tax=Linum tenue TaxID=586396 RepID=A0AAV0PEK1_9ROSI|nr:unnamed protein product [Linum tenue]
MEGETKQGSQDRSQQQQPQPPAQKCPRCDSVNTKFCYYNNYSLSQPRYFCKACRRYWTQGGTLRNVPVGGGCRKGKRAKTSSSASSSSSSASQSPTTTSSAGHQFLGSSNLSLPSQYMISPPLPPAAGLGSYYPGGAAGFLNPIQSLNPNLAGPAQALLGSASSGSNLGLMQGFGGSAFAAGANQFFGGGNNPRQEENLMMGFPNSVSQHQMPSWQRPGEEEYDVSAGGSVPDTALWSISTSTTVEAAGKGGEKAAGGGVGGSGGSVNQQRDLDRRWNHGGGGGQLPGYGPS